MKKTIAVLLAALTLLLGVSALAGTDYTMKYLPGTEDAVSGLPPEDTGTGGEAYAVSGSVPSREGYEFISWTLDYDVAASYSVEHVLRKADGTEVVLDSEINVPVYSGETVYKTPNNYEDRHYYSDDPGEIVNRTVSDGEVIRFYYYEILTKWTVRYVEDQNGVLVDLVPPVLRTNKSIGTVVEETALEIDEYDLADGESAVKQLTLVEDAAQNVITFHYVPIITSAAVRFVTEGGKDLIPSMNILDLRTGESFTGYAEYIKGWVLQNDSEEETIVLVRDPAENVITFHYAQIPTEYIVRCLTIDGDILSEKYYDGVNVDESLTVFAPEIKRYSCISGEEITIESLSEDPEDNVFEFYYTMY